MFGIYSSIKWHYNHDFLWPTYRRLVKFKVNRVRRKEKISVLFIIAELGSWKTRLLYETMLQHQRFAPILGVTAFCDNLEGKDSLVKFLNEHNYSFVDLDSLRQSDNFSPDIVFYQKPYDYIYANKSLRFDKHLSSLFCFVNYGFHVVESSWCTNQALYNCLWQQYFENNLTASPKRMAMLPDCGKQVVVTGLPVQDQLLQPKELLADPWKKQNKPKKRIIYAPHHTIGDLHADGLAISSFLENGEFMLKMMRKYSDEVQWAFKPHPLLYGKLLSVWGKEKTNRYYDEWKKAENSQFENGEYDALFKYSDAMIHDCSSFTVEYHFTCNPVMYLIRENGAENEVNAFGQKAFDLHYKGLTHEEIEQFIQNVIDDIDPMKSEREAFFNEYLLPPHGKAACQNIINAILGEEEYKRK